MLSNCAWISCQVGWKLPAYSDGSPAKKKYRPSLLHVDVARPVGTSEAAGQTKLPSWSGPWRRAAAGATSKSKLLSSLAPIK